MEVSGQKAIGVTIGVSLVSLLVFVLIGLMSRDPAALGQPLGLLTIVLVLAWVAIVASAFSMLHNFRRHRQAIAAAAAIASALAGLFTIPAIIGGVLLLLFLLAASRAVAQTTNERIAFRLKPIIMPGTRLIIAGLALATAALLLPLVRQQVSNGGIFIPTDSIELALRPATPILQNLIPGYTPDGTVDELIDKQLQGQQQALPLGFTPPVEQQRAQVRQEVSELAGIPLTGSETVPDVLSQYLNNSVSQLATRNGLLVVVGLIVIGLVAVRAIVPIMAWVALGLAAGIFWLARKTEFIHITQAQLPVEQMRL